MRLRLILALVILTVIGSTAASAGPIVVRPLESGRIGEYSNLGPAGVDHQQVADTFVLAQATTLESITWYGRYDQSVSTLNPFSFSVRIFLDDAGKPANAWSWVKEASVNASLQGTNYLGDAWLTYSMSLPAWTLGPGTYWLSIVENAAATPPVGMTQWLWGDTTGSGPRATRNQDGAQWAASADWPHAFTLEGTVPDAGSTLLLFGMGLAALRACSKRRQ